MAGIRAAIDTNKQNMIISINPATGQKLGEVPCATPYDVAAAVDRAREAQIHWAGIGVKKRNQILDRLRGVMIDRAEEIGGLVSSENGKPHYEAMSLILPISEAIKLYTTMAKKLENGKKVSATYFLGDKAFIFYEPLGVAGFILPWNFPFELGIKHMIPALAAGNAVVQKPSEENPLIGELILSLFKDAGMPENVVQMVHGFADTGAALIDAVDVVCFVGSPDTGRKIMARAAQTLTPVVLELGGNDAAIVRSDADLLHTAKGLVNGTCYNAGQVCNGIERIYWPPTVLTGMTHDMIMMKEETFGPFLPIMAVDNDEEAIRLANDSPYGEQAYYTYTSPKSLMISSKKAADFWMPYGKTSKEAILCLMKLFSGISPCFPLCVQKKWCKSIMGDSGIYQGADRYTPRIG
ncbi:MAG: aldehyde dehydrogenase family protein [Proteobacteria bacterium]|nr:aldehyde dehydrogenase family protein [Pseudomonadota bacterium]